MNGRSLYLLSSLIRRFCTLVCQRQAPLRVTMIQKAAWRRFLIELIEMADRVMVVIVHPFTKKRICSVNRSLCFQPNLMETQKV